MNAVRAAQKFLDHVPGVLIDILALAAAGVAKGRDLVAHRAAHVAEAEGPYPGTDLTRDIARFAELTARPGAAALSGCHA
jgi:hypothetical protein